MWWYVRVDEGIWRYMKVNEGTWRYVMVHNSTWVHNDTCTLINDVLFFLFFLYSNVHDSMRWYVTYMLITDVLKCTRMYLNIPKCTKMYSNKPDCTWMYPNSEHTRTYLNVPEHILTLLECAFRLNLYHFSET